MPEDMAYCLPGIFNVAMPMIYSDEITLFVNCRRKADIDKLIGDDVHRVSVGIPLSDPITPRHRMRPIGPVTTWLVGDLRPRMRYLQVVKASPLHVAPDYSTLFIFFLHARNSNYQPFDPNGWLRIPYISPSPQRDPDYDLGERLCCRMHRPNSSRPRPSFANSASDIEGAASSPRLC